MVRAIDEPEWTPLRGLMKAAWLLAWRSVIAVLILAALIWVATPLLNSLYFHWFPLIGLVVACTIPGAGLGASLGKRLSETAGMNSLLLTLMSGAFAFACAFGAVELASLLRPLGDWQSFVVPFSILLFAVIWLVKATLIED